MYVYKDKTVQFQMSIFRLIKYKRVTNKRRKYASLALSLALAHASFGQVKYKSLGNGMADITLALEQDNRFKLDYQPFTTNDNKLSLKGKWHAEEDRYVLKFNRKRSMLKTLFTSNTGFEKLTEVQNGTVFIPKNEVGVVISGIYCQKRLS